MPRRFEPLAFDVQDRRARAGYEAILNLWMGYFTNPITPDIDKIHAGEETVRDFYNLRESQLIVMSLAAFRDAHDIAHMDQQDLNKLAG